jgi:hypothetical protein
MTRSLLLALALVLAAFPAWAGERAGEVLALVGACAADGADGRRALASGAPVAVGDVVTVAAGGRLKLRMVDGSVVSLSENSSVTIAKFAVSGDARDARLDLAKGLIRAVVSKMGQPSTFEVGTATAVAAVRSTDWFLEALPQFTRLGVLHGRVALTSAATGKAVEVPDRFGARVEPGKDPITPRLWSDAEFDDYIRATAIP